MWNTMLYKYLSVTYALALIILVNEDMVQDEV